MSRIKFETNKQKEFIDNLLEKSGLSLSILAIKAGINPRTLRDWRREKYFADYKIILEWALKYNINLKKYNIKQLDSYWYTYTGAKKGALRRMQLYGPIGTTEGRIKGGRNSQLNRRLNPEKYKELGCIVKKKFSIPQLSRNLAEAIGIIMGDGGITNYQITITLSRLVDQPYAKHVQDLFYKVFGENPTVKIHNDNNSITLTLSGIGLVETLEKLGLHKGNKIAHQITYPNWIEANQNYKIACFRGLFDTDGGLYFHKKKSGTYMGWCFSSYSNPLLTSSYKLIKEMGLRATVEKGNRIYIYNKKDITKYMKIVGSNNYKNNLKFKSYIQNQNSTL